MHQTNVMDEVRTILADYLFVDIEKVTPQSDLRHELGIDSLDLVELIAIMQDHFGTTNCAGHPRFSVRTVEDIVTYMDALQGDQALALSVAIA